jgi:amino acid permease
MVGYPILCLLHIILIGPFAELSSAFPVSGAMATWSWRAAKAGVRHERQWGWFVSGIVLAGHLGKVSTATGISAT